MAMPGRHSYESIAISSPLSAETRSWLDNNDGSSSIVTVKCTRQACDETSHLHYPNTELQKPVLFLRKVGIYENTLRILRNLKFLGHRTSDGLGDGLSPFRRSAISTVTMAMMGRHSLMVYCHLHHPLSCRRASFDGNEWRSIVSESGHQMPSV
ncbi:hypothetical protein HAX54_002004 [Datura stramonium]|uniref:Uncharacterized protein n=1 Tax=Datura stramonium TaxID=4076 RepID=A0ABS8WTE8_DATST|nr:hypothetical protein [Datura stramonium]